MFTGPLCETHLHIVIFELQAVLWIFKKFMLPIMAKGGPKLELWHLYNIAYKWNEINPHVGTWLANHISNPIKL